MGGDKIDLYKRFSILFCTIFLLLILQGTVAAESNYTVDYSTYLGDKVVDEARDVYVDDSGYIYVTGSTHVNGSKDVFVTKFNVTREVIYHTILTDTSGDDWGHRIVADGDGYAYVVGEINHDGLKVADAFISKIDPSGKEVKRVYIGGSGYDVAKGLAIDYEGNIYVSGYTISTVLNVSELGGGTARVPGTNPNATPLTDWTYHGGYDAFLARFDQDLNPVNLRYFGGSWDDYCQGITIDYAGNIYITGYTYSDDFPVTFDAISGDKRGTTDIFLSRFTPDLNCDYSTYLGGSGPDFCYSIISRDSRIYLAGKTNSSDFPVTPNAYQKTRNGSSDGFIMVFNDYSVEYSTYLGGRGDDSINDITQDILGNLYLTGWTGSDNFPLTPGAYDSSLSGVDAFVMKFSIPKGVLYSSYLGGIEADQGYGVAVDRYQNIYVAGKTWSSNFTVTPDACKKNLTGLSDGFLTRFTPFIISNISVTPLNGTGPLTVTLRGNITNCGDSTGWYRLDLYINGYRTAGKWVEVGSLETEPFEFEYTLRNSRAYSVGVNNFPPATVRVFLGPLILPENLRVTPSGGQEPLKVNVTADLVNYGDLPDSYTAELYIDGVLLDSRNVTVNASSRTTVSFNRTLAAGLYEITINDLEPELVYVMEGEKFYIENFTLTPQSGAAPLTVTVSAMITNIDSNPRSYTATIYVNGVPDHTKVLNIPGESTVPFSTSILLPDRGLYTISLNNNVSGTVRVLSEANFTLSNVTVSPVEGKSPLNVTVTAIVRNNGDLAGDFAVTLYLDDVAWETRTVSVPGKSSVLVSFKKELAFPGEYRLRLNSGTDVTIRVLEPDPTITGFNVTPVTGPAPLSVRASLNVTNPHDLVIGFTARLMVDGVVVQENIVSLSPGETREIAMGTLLTPGNHTVGINEFSKIVRVLRPASITLSDLRVTPSSGFSPLTITATATARNTGEVDGNYTAVLYINGLAVDEKNVTVGAGRSVQVAFNHTIENAGIYLAGIGSLTPLDVRVLSEPAISNLSATPLTGVSPHRIIVTALVSTTEEGSGNYTAGLYIDGVNVQNRTVRVTGPGSVLVSFTADISEPGEHQVTVNSLSPVTVRVLRPATFIVDSLTVSPSTGVIPFRVNASVRVTNIGDIAGNYTARLYIDGVNVQNRTVNVPAGGDVTVSFTYNITQRGNHTVWIDNPPGINVNALKPATLEIRSFSVTPGSAVGSVNANVSAEIENSGDLEGEFSIPFYLNGSLIRNETIRLGPGERGNINFQQYLSGPGVYTFSLGNLRNSTVYVNPARRKYSFTFRNTGKYTTTVTYYVTVYSSTGAKLGYRTFKFTLKPGRSYSATIGYYPYDARIVTTRKIYNPSRYTRTIKLSETFRADTLSATLNYSNTIRGYRYVYIKKTFRAVNMRITVT
ncbi:MAG: SBBP repeat-containing protein [Methanothermobacter sp.]|nr:SBBP repeat-containing protein [Methanothermobacter sp.]